MTTAIPPKWLSVFANRLATTVDSYELLAPLACHYQEVDGTWEVSLFCGGTEIIGGEYDGEMRCSRFFLDLLDAMQLFDHLECVTWQAQPMGERDDLGPHVSIQGKIGEHPVWLRILAQAPEQFSPGRKAIVYENTLEEQW